MKKTTLLFLAILTMSVFAQFPSNTGIKLKDLNGEVWDVDQLLNDGKHIVFHQTGSG